MTNPSSLFEALTSAPLPANRPLIILAWAQTLNGSVARIDSSPLSISSPASFRFTHRLRAFCDGLLIGIGAALADDPQLTVRDVSGRHPQPIVLDTHLRLPPDARLLDHPSPPWLLCGPYPHPQRQQRLSQRGALIQPLPLAQNGRIDLDTALAFLRNSGIRTLMVEGGPTIHAAFLDSNLADWLAATISPQLLAGLPALNSAAARSQPDPTPLDSWQIERIGPDLLAWGRIRH